MAVSSKFQAQLEAQLQAIHPIIQKAGFDPILMIGYGNSNFGTPLLSASGYWHYLDLTGLSSLEVKELKAGNIQVDAASNRFGASLTLSGLFKSIIHTRVQGDIHYRLLVVPDSAPLFGEIEYDQSSFQGSGHVSGTINGGLKIESISFPLVNFQPGNITPRLNSFSGALGKLNSAINAAVIREAQTEVVQHIHNHLVLAINQGFKAAL